MEFTLSLEEVRVLGSLMEKEKTTPEYYPLTLRSLTTACNQKTNRNPVVDFDERMVARAIESLRQKRLAFRVDTAGSRVPKYRHSITTLYPFSEAEAAIICVLLLRGPQTVGELRQRTERLYCFESLSNLQETLDDILELDQSFAVCLPAQPGQKESRYRHQFAGEIVEDAFLPSRSAPLETATLEVLAERKQEAEFRAEIDALRQTVDGLQADLNQLKESFAAFKSEFE